MRKDLGVSKQGGGPVGLQIVLLLDIHRSNCLVKVGDRSGYYLADGYPLKGVSVMALSDL